MIFVGWLLRSRSMEELSVADAAAYLGISKEATHKAVRENRLRALPGTDPVRLSHEAVEEFHHLKMDALVASLARSGMTPVSAAAKVRRGLFANEMGLPRPFAVKLAAMPDAWRSLFNKAELAAACVPDGEGCRWCRCAEFSGFLGLRPTPYAPAYVELFGGQPCQTCGPGLRRPFMAALEARVHPGRHRPPDARAEAVAAAAAAVPPVPRPQPAQPLQGDDDGRSMVQRRLRETRARLKVAKRAGGQQAYVLRLAQMVQSLERDAAAVDGRPVTAAAGAKPRVSRFMGDKACGTPVGQSCACHPGPKRRGRR